MQGKLIGIERVSISPGRMSLDVRLADACPRLTDGAIADAAIKRFPTIAMHACRNAKGPTFGCVMDETSIPHLLEHVLIELQLEAAESETAMLAGNTRWTDEGQGQARVQVSFVDDSQALQALAKATEWLELTLGRKAQGADEGNGSMLG